MSEVLREVTLDASACELAQAVADRRVSALELADAAIARIAARNPKLNAIVTPDFDRAREAARTADAAAARGERLPLLGVPMTVKESHNVAGLPTTWGFPRSKAWIAPRDGLAVARLKAAGAVILGKTNVPVGLSDMQSENPVHGRTVNPWDPERTPGGSSGGGAAAVAAGLVPLEFGSDLGGSLRAPAAFCGIYSHRPSTGLVPMRGQAPPGVDGPPPPMGVVGPMARTPADLQLALDVTAGPEPEEAIAYRLALPPARGERLGEFRVLVLDRHPLAKADGEVLGALSNLADRLAAAGVALRRGGEDLPDLAEAQETFLGIVTARAPQAADAPPVDVQRWLRLLAIQLEHRRAWGAVFGDIDLVLAPAFATPAFRHFEEPDFGRRTLEIDGRMERFAPQTAWLSFASLASLPVTVAPIAFSRAGLPIGIQIIGPYLEDRTPLRFAALLEQAFGGFRPPPRL